MAVISENLGHAKKSTTQNFYQGIAQQTMHKDAVMRMEERHFKKPLEKPLESHVKQAQKKIQYHLQTCIDTGFSV